jgi:anti-sigma factor RsiW
MNCNEMKLYIDRFVEGEIDASRHKRIEGHLQTCSNCYAEVRVHQKLWAMLGEMNELEPAPDYLERFRQRAAAGVPWYLAIVENARAFFRRRWSVPAFSAAAAAVVVVAVVSLHLFPQLPSDGITTAGIDVDMDLLSHLELVENFDIINEFEFLSDLEIIEKLNGREAS